MNQDNYLLCKHILLVDDEPELLSMVVSILNEYGFHHISTAQNVKTALVETEKHSPDLAILDVMLPDGNGFALMEQLKRSSDCPVLFLTACGKMPISSRALVWARMTISLNLFFQKSYYFA